MVRATSCSTGTNAFTFKAVELLVSCYDIGGVYLSRSLCSLFTMYIQYDQSICSRMWLASDGGPS